MLKKPTPNQNRSLKRVQELCADILDVCDIYIGHFRDDRDKLVPHMVAAYTDHDGGYAVRKAEPLDRYFSPEVFSIGLTQRADWLHASTEVKAACFKAKPMIHPAHYRKTMKL